jgi:chaperonin GroEL
MRSGKGNYGSNASRFEIARSGSLHYRLSTPTKVVDIVPENAVSVASVLLLAEATLTEVPEEKKKSAPASESFD